MNAANNIMKKIESKLLSNDLSSTERVFLEREYQIYLEILSIDFKKKMNSDLNTGIFEDETYEYIISVLDQLIFPNQEISFETKAYDYSNLLSECFNFFKETTEYEEIINHYEYSSDVLYKIEKDCSDHCFVSEHGAHVSIDDTENVITEIKLAHEIQHQINMSISAFASKTHFSEAPSIFIEMLIADYMYKKTKHEDYLNSYLFRLIDISETARILRSYLTMMKFCNNNHEQLISYFNYTELEVNGINVMNSLATIFSYLFALSIKEKYDYSNVEGMYYFNSLLNGEIMNMNINFNEEYEKGIRLMSEKYNSTFGNVK